MKPNSLEARDAATQLHSYSNLSDLEKDGTMLIGKGDGVYVEDIHGKRYLEGMAGLWSASLGFSQERLAKTAYDQVSRVSSQR